MIFKRSILLYSLVRYWGVQVYCLDEFFRILLLYINENCEVPVLMRNSCCSGILKNCLIYLSLLYHVYDIILQYFNIVQLFFQHSYVTFLFIFFGSRKPNLIHLQVMTIHITTLVEEIPLAHVVDSEFVDKVCAHCMVPHWER